MDDDIVVQFVEKFARYIFHEKIFPSIVEHWLIGPLSSNDDSQETIKKIALLLYSEPFDISMIRNNLSLFENRQLQIPKKVLPNGDKIFKTLQEKHSDLFNAVKISDVNSDVLLTDFKFNWIFEKLDRFNIVINFFYLLYDFIFSYNRAFIVDYRRLVINYCINMISTLKRKEQIKEFWQLHDFMKNPKFEKNHNVKLLNFDNANSIK